MPGFKRNSRSRRRELVKITPKNIKIVVGIFTAIILISLIILFWRNNQTNNEKIIKTQQIENQISEVFDKEALNDIEIEKKAPKDKILNIVALGNISYNHELYEGLFDNQKGTYLFLDFLSKVSKFTEVSDYTIASLGANITADYKIENGKTNAPEDLGLAIKNAGINLLFTASRNSNDDGQTGIEKTLEELDKLKLEHVGTARAKIEQQTPVIKEILGIKLGFLSYTENLNKKINEEYMINRISKTKIVEDISKIKEKGAEFVIVSLDMGKSGDLTQNQKELIKHLINNDANVILCYNDSGIVGKIEMVQNEEGQDRCIAYNMGNFIGKNESEDSKFEIALDIEITKSIEDNITRITKVNYSPMYLLDRGENNNERYLLLDIKQEISRYESNVTSNLTDEEYKKAIEGLEKLDKRIMGE